MNVVISKTIPVGEPVVAHEIFFSGLESFKFAQIWLWDEGMQKYRQLTTQGAFVDGMLPVNVAQLSMPSGKMVLVFYNQLEAGAAQLAISNQFNYQIGDQTIIGGSSNLGDVPASFPYLTPQAPTATPPPSTKKRKK